MRIQAPPPPNPPRDATGPAIDRLIYILADRECDIPEAPAWLPLRAIEEWRRLWSTPESALWTTGDYPLVAMMAFDVAALEDALPSDKLLDQIAKLADRLLLSPRARRLSRVRIVDELPSDEPAAPPEPKDDREARRLALLRQASGDLERSRRTA